ncbi:hypothetical protein [Methanobrevibacter boviskoreani]|uniref:hypothetical protein n=1 Tax=Methanobrevibacter boviskoreani TaxID=1348249 RepID=UPI002A917C5E|nr:hypothetical protein [Methanobrevibacter boviskoreani]MDY5614350.1 hypothetical protein [Methanobrevibacter boviskoreani]
MKIKRSNIPNLRKTAKNNKKIKTQKIGKLWENRDKNKFSRKIANKQPIKKNNQDFKKKIRIQKKWIKKIKSD